MFPICKLLGSCYCSAPCPGRNTSSGSCPLTKPRPSLPHMTGQSLLAWRHSSVSSPPGRFLANSATCGRAQLAMQHGGLGLHSTAAHFCAAYFASWADALRAIEARDPQLWATAALQLQRPACTWRCLIALRDAVHSFEAAGFQAPPWNQLARTSPPQEHRASCPRSGLLRPRAIPLERAAARMCREAGATVSTNVFLRDLNLVVHNQDDIEVIANGLPLWGGAQLAVDTTLVSALDSAGQPRRQQRSTSGAALRIAGRAKERTYPELLRAERCRLVVLGIELGGRWSSEAAQFVRMLARSRARSAPHVLRSGATAAYVSSWSALLSFAAAGAVAASLLALPLGNAANVDGAALDLSDVLAETFSAPPLASRLPLRASP